MEQREKDVVHVLAESYCDRDWESISRILSSYRPFLMRVVSQRFDHRMQARLDPADVVQDVLLEVTCRLGNYLERRPMLFRAWLHQTACQRLLMVWREHKRSRRRSVDREIPLGDILALGNAYELMGTTEGSDLEQVEWIAVVFRALKGLPKVDRELIVMRNLDNLSNLEAAELLGMQPAAASKRYGRALLRLRELLRSENSSVG